MYSIIIKAHNQHKLTLADCNFKMLWESAINHHQSFCMAPFIWKLCLQLLQRSDPVHPIQNPVGFAVGSGNFVCHDGRVGITTCNEAFLQFLHSRSSDLPNLRPWEAKTHTHALNENKLK